MEPTDYEQKKREFKKKMLAELFKTKKAFVNYENDIFTYTFDRAYILGKQAKDAEGEEILTVSRKAVQEMYAANEMLKADFPNSEISHTSDQINHVLRNLFGFRCVPDNVESLDVNVDSLQPKSAEPLSQNPAENCDNTSHISKGSTNDFYSCALTFTDKCKSQERRLNIAATLLSGILAREAPCRHPVKRALELTDTLIAESGINRNSGNERLNFNS